MAIRITLIMLMLAVILAGCAQKQEPSEAQNSPGIEERAAETIKALQNKDMQRLSEMVQPGRHLLFSPYAYVDEEDQQFTSEEVKTLLADQTIYAWGRYDGSGEAIELNFTDYYDEFVYDEDFINADQISYNTRLGQGNTIDNAADAFPGSTVVEYHFTGFDPQYEGMDWKSLRLVFKQMDGDWYLQAVIHDQWTI
jgi:hypothetical protein